MATRKAFKIVGLIELAALLVAGGVFLGFWLKDRRDPPSNEGNNHRAECLSRMKFFAGAAGNFAASHRGRLPESLEALLAENGLDKALLENPLADHPGEPGYEYLLPGEELSCILEPSRTVLLRSLHTTEDGRRFVALVDGSVQEFRDSELAGSQFATVERGLRVGMMSEQAQFLIGRASLAKAEPRPVSPADTDAAYDFYTLPSEETLAVGRSLSRERVTSLTIFPAAKSENASAALPGLAVQRIELPKGRSAIVELTSPAKP
jgi:hypothetical protein